MACAGRLLAVQLTLQGRVYVEIYGHDRVDFAFSVPGVAQTLAAFALVGAAVGLILETAGAYRRTHRVLGSAILLAYLFAHLLVVPVGESWTVLARRLRSTNQTVFLSGIERVCRSPDPRDVDLLLALFPTIMKDPEPRSSSSSRRSPVVLDTITLSRGVEFWRDYLQSEQGQATGPRPRPPSRASVSGVIPTTPAT